MATTTPILSLPLITSDSGLPSANFNEASIVVEVFAAGSVIDVRSSPPSGTPSDGDAYILTESPSGLWSGKSENVAIWYDGWRYVAPQDGMILKPLDESVPRQYVAGLGWVPFPVVTAEPDSNGLFDAILLVQLGDVAISSPGAAEDGYPVVWDNDTQKFVLAETTIAGEFKTLADVEPSWNGSTSGDGDVFMRLGDQMVDIPFELKEMRDMSFPPAIDRIGRKAVVWDNDFDGLGEVFTLLPHIPPRGSEGDVLTKVSDATDDFAWRSPETVVTAYLDAVGGASNVGGGSLVTLVVQDDSVEINTQTRVINFGAYLTAALDSNFIVDVHVDLTALESDLSVGKLAVYDDQTLVADDITEIEVGEGLEVEVASDNRATLRATGGGSGTTPYRTVNGNVTVTSSDLNGYIQVQGASRDVDFSSVAGASAGDTVTVLSEAGGTTLTGCRTPLDGFDAELKGTNSYATMIYTGSDWWIAGFLKPTP